MKAGEPLGVVIPGQRESAEPEIFLNKFEIPGSHLRCAPERRVPRHFFVLPASLTSGKVWNSTL